MNSFTKTSDILAWRTIQNCKRNHIVARGGESKEHFLAKCEECWNLHNDKKTFYTEAEFKNGSGRADIYCIEDEEAIEIMVWEKQESLDRKRKEYPVPVRAIHV